MEKLIHRPKVYSYNWPEGDDRHLKVGRPVDNDCYIDAIRNNKIGDRIVIWAGAPGIGRWVYQITRMDETGVYGIEIENTVHILEPWEDI